jgi:hypothetical protein
MSSKGNNHMLNGFLIAKVLSNTLPVYTATAMATKNWVAIAAYFIKDVLFFLFIDRHGYFCF